MAGPLNAQEFIRALKASSDPPYAGGPPKIEVARKAWDNVSLYVPNKAEAIVDWILSALLKEKSRQPSDNPICDSRYWHLLADILSHSTSAKSSESGHRAWLVPLLNRIPIAPIILSYLDLRRGRNVPDQNWCGAVVRSISVLWPLAAPKINVETLLDCFGAVLQLGMSTDMSEVSGGRSPALEEFRALSVIVSSYRSSLANSTAKRKQLYALFLKKHLLGWLRLVSRALEGEAATLAADIYDAGIETLFGLDTIKQAADHKHDVALLEALEAALGEAYQAVLCSLPRLTASYVESVKRHKSALFSQGSGQVAGHITEQVQRATMAFYAGSVSLAQKGADEIAWKCRVSLLEMVEKENLLSPKDEEAKALLRREGDLAVEVLAGAWDDKRVSRTDCAVKMLTTLTRIDYDLTSPSFVTVYSRMLAVHNDVSSSLPYLNLLLEYESKTRSLPSTLSHILDAFSVHNLERIPGGPKVAYKIASAGPLTSLPFLDEISRTVHNFLTPGQVIDTTTDVCQRLRETYDRFIEHDAKQSAERGEGPRKKRKRDMSILQEHRSEAEYHAVALALTARMVAVVLRALPLQSVTDDVRENARRLVGSVHADIAVRALSDGFVYASPKESWARQVALAGVLRLHYDLAHASVLPTQPPLEKSLCHTMLSCMKDESILPELVVEMLRVLLHQCCVASLEPGVILDAVLDYLEDHNSNMDALWSGKAHAIDTNDTGAVAVMHVLVDIWLLEFDAWANEKQLERFAAFIATADVSSLVLWHSKLSMRNVFIKLLRNAQFWELVRLRDAFLAQLVKQTLPLDGFDLSVLSSISESSPRLSSTLVAQVAQAYDVLLLVPSEYIPRAMHLLFLQRGFAADIAVTLSLLYEKKPQVSERQLVVIRKVLRHSIALLDTIETLAESPFWAYLLEPRSLGSGRDTGLSSSTMDLVDMYQTSLVRSAKRGNGDILCSHISQLVQVFDPEMSDILKRAVLLLIDSIVQNAPSASFSSSCVEALHALYEQLREYTAKVFSLGNTEDLLLDQSLLDAWSHQRTLARWLKTDEQFPSIGKPLARKLLTWGGDLRDFASLAPIVMSILLGELQSSGANHSEEVEYAIVGYLSLNRFLGQPSDLLKLETGVVIACRTLSIETFSTMLEYSYEALTQPSHLSEDDIAGLIRLSSILLRDAPEGTSKLCQAHTTKCINLFADREQFTTVCCLRRESLEFLVRQCNDRPASIRIADLPSTWSFLQALLAESPAHDTTTDLSVFHGVVNVLSTLIRLRRDLVLYTLPHLGHALRRLITCLRAPRPQLGGKQRRLVMDTLPRWIAASSSTQLGAAESKSLARLLTTLTTKTLVRTHAGASAGTEQHHKSAQASGKPESLARPFAKHAAYVLTAYADAANDTLCVLPAAARRELQPGLFALCDMVGEHSRDAMMVSALDAGGKATMKALWREYEKQRYVGKG